MRAAAAIPLKATSSKYTSDYPIKDEIQTLARGGWQTGRQQTDKSIEVKL